MFDYALQIHRETDSIWLSAVDIPELHIASDTLEQALSSALDDFEAVLSLYVTQRRFLPVGHTQPQAEEVYLRLSARTAAKITLWPAAGLPPMVEYSVTNHSNKMMSQVVNK